MFYINFVYGLSCISSVCLSRVCHSTKEIEIERERERERERKEKQRERETQRERERQREGFVN